MKRDEGENVAIREKPNKCSPYLTEREYMHAQCNERLERLAMKLNGWKSI
jgi:hypothetical protein